MQIREALNSYAPQASDTLLGLPQDAKSGEVFSIEACHFQVEILVVGGKGGSAGQMGNFFYFGGLTLAPVALVTSASVPTAIRDSYSYKDIFISGNSPNILEARAFSYQVEGAVSLPAGVLAGIYHNKKGKCSITRQGCRSLWDVASIRRSIPK